MGYIVTIFLYSQERTKALGYMSTNMRAADEALQAMDEEAARRPPDNVNELHIKLIRCSGLKARRESMWFILIYIHCNEVKRGEILEFS